MPRESALQEGNVTQKSIDKEQKRNQVPCSSCKRRGCSAICPNGSLMTGKGTRLVLARTERLHDKISRMSDRIRQLEDALAILQSSVSPGEQHPLLSRDLLSIKSSIDLHAAAEEDPIAIENTNIDEVSRSIEAFGVLAVRDDGVETFYGPSAGSESLLIGEPPEASLPSVTRDLPHDLPSTVKGLAASFPFCPSTSQVISTLDSLPRHLPPWKRAHQLCELYLCQAPWFFGPVTRRQLMEECLPSWYSEAKDLIPLGSVTSTSEPSQERINKGPHDLALLFIIFCLGALLDDTLPSAPDNEEARMYVELARAAMNLEPVFDRPPSVATVQALALLSLVLGILGGDNSVEGVWGTLGLAARFAQSIGLHRDCARWNLPPLEVQKRRTLFWELYITDCWGALATGRNATFHLPYVDCELPNDPDANINDEGSVVPGFSAWKAMFARECVSAVTQHIQATRVPKYSDITALDRKIRDIELPTYTQHRPEAGAGLEEAMKYYVPSNYRNMTLLYVHRCFFVEALSSNPANPMKSPYAPSFLAGYRSSWEILANVRAQFDLHPAQIARLWHIWSHAFVSSVILSSVVTHTTLSGTRSKFTTAALAEFRRAVVLFKEASAYGSRAGKFLPILQRILQKAEQAYKTSTPVVDHNKDIFTPSTYDEPTDELSILGGQSYKVSIKAPSRPVFGPDGTSNSEIANFLDLHPSLREQWLIFDGQINSQISDASWDVGYSEQDTEAPLEDGSLTVEYRSHPAHSSFSGVAQLPPFPPTSSTGNSTSWYGGNYKDCQPTEQVTGQRARHLDPPPTSSIGPYQFQPDVGQFSHSHPEPPLPSHDHMSHAPPPNPHHVELHYGHDTHSYSDPAFQHIWPQYPHSDSVVHPQYSLRGSQHRNSAQPSSNYLPVSESVSSHPTTDYASQNRLQETWQSFGMYIGSPTSFSM